MYDVDLERDGLHRSAVHHARDVHPMLGLQTWAEAQPADRHTSRFGGYERQIEADVLRDLGHVIG